MRNQYRIITNGVNFRIQRRSTFGWWRDLGKDYGLGLFIAYELTTREAAEQMLNSLKGKLSGQICRAWTPLH